MQHKNFPGQGQNWQGHFFPVLGHFRFCPRSLFSCPRSGQGHFREIGRLDQSDLGHFFPALGHFFPALGQGKVTFAKSARRAKVT